VLSALPQQTSQAATSREIVLSCKRQG